MTKVSNDTPTTLVDLPNSWVPWPQHGGNHAGIGRPFLLVPAQFVHAHISPPLSDLPLVWRSHDTSCFELPSPTGEGRDATAQRVRVHLFDQQGNETCSEGILRGGVPRPDLAAADDDGPQDAMPPEMLAAGVQAASVVSQHAESISEITFPRKGAGVRPQRAEGLTVSSWSEFDQRFWSREENQGPLRLIVRIAEDCRPVLEDICGRPRRVLRRERRLERLDRVQQMDEACLRWFVRQPGHTILEKAGPRQRVLSVVRLDTPDTPENRVVRDFLERCLRAANSYLREHGRLGPTDEKPPYRILLVRRFRTLLQTWLRRSEVATVPLPAGVPKANYVLQFDQRYSRIWYWYERLRRQQTYEDEMWRWQHRTWAEHVALAVMHVLSELQRQHNRYEGRVYLRTDPQCGRFIDERSPVGAWAVDCDATCLIETVFRNQLRTAAASRPELGSLAPLGPDLVILVRRPFDIRCERILAVWSSLRLPGGDYQAAFSSWHRQLFADARHSCAWDVITPALIVPGAPSSQDTHTPQRFTMCQAGAYAVGFVIPVPVASHLAWLGSQIGDWVHEGVL